MEVSREIYEQLQELRKKGYLWLATDENGTSCTFEKCPTKGEFEWYSGGYFMKIDEGNITKWCDEPILIEDIKCEGESTDNTNPNHYKGSRECIDEMLLMFGEEQVKAFCRLNIFKYRFRAEEKNGDEDLAKAEWYMDYLEKMEDVRQNEK